MESLVDYNVENKGRLSVLGNIQTEYEQRNIKNSGEL